MKMAKRIAAAALACVMSLCVLTACGGSSSGKNSLEDSIVSAFSSKGINVTVSNDLISLAKEGKNIRETDAKEAAEAFVTAFNNWDKESTNDENYKAAEEADKAYSEANSNTHKKLFTDSTDYYKAPIDDGETAEDVVDEAIADIIEYTTENKQNIKEIGYTTLTDSKYVVSGDKDNKDSWVAKYYSTESLLIVWTYETAE